MGILEVFVLILLLIFIVLASDVIVVFNIISMLLMSNMYEIDNC